MDLAKNGIQAQTPEIKKQTHKIYKLHNAVFQFWAKVSQSQLTDSTQ